ncbi:MAG: hypothetical protein K9H16_08145 [Bacteroidales bacterium]|nr:hypothetical protein [Bacteroidales bacterium]
MEKVIKVLKNRYVFIFSLFLVWMIFFDQDNLPRQFQLTREQKEAEEENAYLSTGFKNDSIMNYQLENNRDAQEKYAREHYLIVGKNEKIFLVVDDEE